MINERLPIPLHHQIFLIYAPDPGGSPGEGLHEKQIMALMGHSTTRMSARYSKYGRNARSLMAEAVAKRIVQKIPG